jgi:uncharacterized protein
VENRVEWVLLFLVGIAAGTLGSLVGLGGGIIVVPALIYLGTFIPTIGEISPQVAVGTSLIVVIFTGLSSTLAYMKYKTVDYKSGLLFFIGSGPGGIVGAFVNKSMDVQSFSLYFGIFMIMVSIILMVRGKIKPIKATEGKYHYSRSFINDEGVESNYGFNPMIALPIAFIVGFISGLFGVGGGSLMVPAMILLFLFPPHIAVATSMFMIFLSAITSSIAHISLGNVNWLLTLVLVPGAWLGAMLGAKINTRLKGNTVINLLRIILIILGIRLIFQGFN